MRFSYYDDAGKKQSYYVEFSEDPDSVEIQVTEAGIFAQRKIKVSWAGVWPLMQGLGTVASYDPNDWAKQYDDDTIFPTWPAGYGGWAILGDVSKGTGDTEERVVPSQYNYYGSSLQLTNIRVSPSWGGRQKGITTEAERTSTTGLAANTIVSKAGQLSGKGDMVAYEYADVILEYEQRNPTKQLNEFHAGTSTVQEKRTVAKQAGGTAQTNISRVESANEVVSFFRSQDFNGSPTAISTLDATVGNVNSEYITLFFGRDHRTFAPETMLFTSFETRYNYFLGQFGVDYFLRFSIAPNTSWRYVWDIDAEAYVQVATSSRIYSLQNFANLFPPQWEVNIFGS
jgi:hypothetical protein